jgi:hypothetical protein
MVDPVSLSSAIAMAVCFILSEVLPFISGTPANGVLQGIVLGISRFAASRYAAVPSAAPERIAAAAPDDPAAPQS